MGEVIEIRPGVSSLDIGNIPECECSKSIIHRALLRIMYSETINAEEVAAIFDQVGSDISIILSFIKDTTVNDSRKRSIWMIAGYYNETQWLTVPIDFLPHFECERREKERTQAFAFSRAYILSKKIAFGHLRNKNLHGYYNEIPNLIIACMRLHQLGVFPKDIGSRSGHITLLSEAIMFAEQLQNGVKNFFIQKTSGVRDLLENITIRQVV